MIVLDKVLEETVTQAVNNLVQTVSSNVERIRGIDSEIKDLTEDIEIFKARLLDASKNSNASELHIVKVAVKRFRAAVNEAQDAVAKYIALNKKHETNFCAKCFHRNIPFPVCGNINVHANEIQCIRAKVSRIRIDHEKDLLPLVDYQKNDEKRSAAPPPPQAQPAVEEDSIMGFDDDLETTKNRLTSEALDDYIIPIVGMPGSGKTTFAYQIFKDQNIQKKFDHLIWVHVSQNFEKKQKFINIMDQISKHKQDFSKIPDDHLGEKIKDLLKDTKYFIVMDDVWEKKDWDSLRATLPEKPKGSKVLVTTRNCKVVDSIKNPVVLREFTPEESWSVLKKKVFGKEECHDKPLQDLGVKIAARCNRPLALVMIAGILSQSRTYEYWEQVAQNPFIEINRKDQSYRELVMMSYNHLPHEKLRNCFLYFASFPMGQEIAAWKLIRLWIAEEFIYAMDDWGYTLDLEVEARNYLNDLADRNLVMVMKRKADGQIKTCRIHDSLHEFCKSEAAKNNLFHVMDRGQRLDENTVSCRRLCFHSYNANFFDAENSPSHFSPNCFNKKKIPSLNGERVHSLLLSSAHESDIDDRLTKVQLTTIRKTFPLLRVLDLESLKLNLLPDELYGLCLLKYLAVTTIDLKILPERFNKLHELETLIFNTTKATLKIAGGIWNMEKLRHMHTNTSTQLPFPPNKGKISFGSTDIRTLSTISPASCTEAIFSKTPKLQKLGVRGNLSDLLEKKQEICLFSNLQRLDQLENLKLYGQSEKELKAPMLHNISHKLRKITFSKTLFEWNCMIKLGLMEELEVLKLDDNAFEGENWDLENHVVFNRLKYLRIGRTNLKTWKVSEKSFPVLESLVLRNCTNLEIIPDAFADIDSLKVMELFHVSETAAHSAKQVEKKIKVKKDKSTKFILHITSLPSQDKAPGATENYVVGLDDEAKKMKDLLISGSTNLTDTAIVGMAGVGKSTLAKLVVENYEIQVEFFSRLWIDVSRTLNKREVLSAVLSQLTPENEQKLNLMTEEALVEETCKCLTGRKYLIVADDVWMSEDLEYLRKVLPDDVNGSRILVTTRKQEVAASCGNFWPVKKLSDEESWELLEKKFFGKEKCSNSSIENHGRNIAADCKGLPLAVVMIAASLKEPMTLEDWRRKAEDPYAIIDFKKPDFKSFLRLDQMDSLMVDCFLYLAAFPRGHEIDVWKLRHLWIAEGFIPASSDEEYIDYFVQRNLLTPSKRRAAGKIKTVIIHDLLHAFCKHEAAKQNLFSVLDGVGGASNRTIHYCRLSLHSSRLQEISEIIKTASVKEVQSFLSFSSGTAEIPKKLLEIITLNAFPKLNVLVLEIGSLPYVPKELYGLNYLRYLAISARLNHLPKEFEGLSELQTLVFHTTETDLKIEAEIWKMPKLKHVLTNAPAQLPSPTIKRSEMGHESSDITTLSAITPTSCTREILDNTPNLQKLGIRGKLAELMESNNGGISLLDNIQKLDRLENLRLIINNAPQGSELWSIPRAEKFPRRIKKLTLLNTAFKWEDLGILGSMELLEVLKLEENAFRGKFCNVSNVAFKKLQYLRIGRSDLVRLKVSKDSFPVLKYLILRNCSALYAVPSAFGEVDSLEVMELHDTNRGAANSAQMLEHANKVAKKGGFRLSVHPPEHLDPAADHNADTADHVLELVGELVSGLVQVVQENASLINGIGDQIDYLVDDLNSVLVDDLNSVDDLKQALKSQNADYNKFLKCVVAKIWKVVHDAEDAIGKFTVERKKHYDRGFLRYMDKVANSAKVNVFAREIRNIRAKVKEIRTDITAVLPALMYNLNKGQPVLQRSMFHKFKHSCFVFIVIPLS